MRKEIQGCVRSNVRINVHHLYPRNPLSNKAESVRQALACPRKCPPGCPGKFRGQTWASASGAAGTRNSPNPRKATRLQLKSLKQVGNELFLVYRVKKQLR